MNPNVAEIVRRAKEIEAEPLPAVMGARIRARIEERLSESGARRFTSWRWLVPATGLAAATAVVALLVVNGSATGDFSSGESGRVVAISDVVEATLGPESRVRVESASEVTLLRGRAKFAVKRRPAGERFVVVAGAVTVEVVGTVFEVLREPVRVRVSEGRVRVRASGRDWMVGAGEEWGAGTGAGAGADPGAGADAVAEADAGAVVVAGAGADAGAGSDAGFDRAAELISAGDIAGARRIYEAIARGDSLSAETALYLLGRLDAQRLGRPADALVALREMERRFPRGRLSRERDLSLIEALFATGRCAQARTAAARFRAAYGRANDADVELKPIPGGPCK
ncbi:MAG: FecR domain-containing protein [Deltaproteobacteria bacterium]|nr:FecR domain-containing protein [Deltaproteobacteria bacterium]